MSVKLLTEHRLEFPSLKGGCTGSSESTLVKMPHCSKSHVVTPIQMKMMSQVYQNQSENPILNKGAPRICRRCHEITTESQHKQGKWP